MPLIELPPPDPPRSLDALTVHPAGPGDAPLVRGAIRTFHSFLPYPPPGWRVAFLLRDARRNVWGAATWGRPVARLEDQRHTLELTRFALAPGLPRNTATWMLARMRAWICTHMPEIHRLIAYHDANRHTGAIYAADNWTKVYEKHGESAWTTRPGRRHAERQHKVKWERSPC